jgi:hypothetical protein
MLIRAGDPGSRQTTDEPVPGHTSMLKSTLKPRFYAIIGKGAIFRLTAWKVTDEEVSVEPFAGLLIVDAPLPVTAVYV